AGRVVGGAEDEGDAGKVPAVAGRVANRRKAADGVAIDERTAQVDDIPRDPAGLADLERVGARPAVDADLAFDASQITLARGLRQIGRESCTDTGGHERRAAGQRELQAERG